MLNPCNWYVLSAPNFFTTGYLTNLNAARSKLEARPESRFLVNLVQAHSFQPHAAALLTLCDRHKPLFPPQRSIVAPAALTT
jgi:hypothetical protein